MASPTILSRNSLQSIRQPGSGVVSLIDVQTYPGNLWFVDSGGEGGDTTSHGFQPYPSSAFLTLDYAIGRCTANQGDTIICMPGHAETVATAAAIDMDVAGVTVIGLGHGAARPTFTLSATGSTFEMAAASCVVRNLLFKTSAVVVKILDLNAADCWIDQCDFLMLTAETAINVDGGGANVCDRTKITGCTFDGSTDGPDEAILLDEVADHVVITGCYFFGLFDDAPIHNPTGSVLTNILIAHNIVIQTSSGQEWCELTSNTTGMIANNLAASPLSDVTPVGLDGGQCSKVQNFASDNIDDTSGVLDPAELT